MVVNFTKNGLAKQVKCGFSWTTFFFPGLAQMFRGEVLFGLVIFFILEPLTLFLFGIYWSFVANKHTARKLVEKGYKPETSEHAKYTLSKWGITSK